MSSKRADSGVRHSPPVSCPPSPIIALLSWWRRSGHPNREYLRGPGQTQKWFWKCAQPAPSSHSTPPSLYLHPPWPRLVQKHPS
ncbi:hypothetical protein DPEC_G00121580 [Dallia pectoralis]|uniref:Uncharacterized protein n=1 Tax=Dallia pectoralis TaxID=75939 RepID=A0ACC2GQ10_DALPE|nr:hypothetical protein DPEC_G00121580 [Dallia pectoralis]